jgi:hypothetical protein
LETARGCLEPALEFAWFLTGTSKKCERFAVPQFSRFERTVLLLSVQDIYARWLREVKERLEKIAEENRVFFGGERRDSQTQKGFGNR